MYPVAILAGGLATRLRPITETIPKAMVEVAGRPFIAWQLDYLASQGITDVVLCVGYLGEQIQEAIGDGHAHGVHVRYVFDGPKLLGTGGALRQALPLLGDAFFIFYGDSYLPIDFRAVAADFEACGKRAMMTVLENDNLWDKSNARLRADGLVDYDKRRPDPDMTHIDYGLGVLRADVLAAYPPGEVFDLADVYHELSQRNELAGHEVFERFYEIGSHEGLKETTAYLQRRGTP